MAAAASRRVCPASIDCWLPEQPAIIASAITATSPRLTARTLLRTRRLLARRPQDQADGPVVEEVVPRPVHEHDDAAAEADDVDQVDEEPHQPAQEPGQANRSELRHGRVAPDRGHDSGVA